MRRNVKIKNRRKATVNRLKAPRFEEALESLSRKLVRVAAFQKPVSVQVKQLEEQMDKAMRQRNQLRLDVQMAQECDEDVASTEDNSSS